MSSNQMYKLLYNKKHYYIQQKTLHIQMAQKNIQRYIR